MNQARKVALGVAAHKGDRQLVAIGDKLRQNSFCQAQVAKSLNPLIEEAIAFKPQRKFLSNP